MGFFFGKIVFLGLGLGSLFVLVNFSVGIIVSDISGMSVVVIKPGAVGLFVVACSCCSTLVSIFGAGRGRG